MTYVDQENQPYAFALLRALYSANLAGLKPNIVDFTISKRSWVYDGIVSFGADFEYMKHGCQQNLLITDNGIIIVDDVMANDLIKFGAGCDRR